MAWASVVIDTENGLPYTAVFQESNIGGAYFPQMHKLGGEITYEQIYLFALKNKRMNLVLGLIQINTKASMLLTGKIFFKSHPTDKSCNNATTNLLKCNPATRIKNYVC